MDSSPLFEYDMIHRIVLGRHDGKYDASLLLHVSLDQHSHRLHVLRYLKLVCGVNET